MTSQSLQDRIEGRVVYRIDPEYESTRSALVWNARKPARYPDMIVQVASENDVVEAVRFAREKHMQIAARGGGHHWSAPAMRQGGILLDLARLNQVDIDPEARVATVQPVVSNRELARQLAIHDLAFPVGHCSTVPLSGFILGGGFGWNAGNWGVSCWSLLSLDVVTAEGRLITASDTENPDLLWAARGAGPGFFGIATRYRLKLYPLPKAITTSTLVYPMEKLSEVVRWATEAVKTFPRKVEFILLFAHAPDALANQSEKVCIVSATAFADSDSEAEEALSGVAACPVGGDLMKKLNVSMTFEDLFDIMDGFFPERRRYAADTLWSAAAPIDVMRIVQDHFNQVPSADSSVLGLILPSPPPDAPPLPDAAFSMLAPVFVAGYAVWKKEEDDAANLSWIGNLMRDLTPHAIGHYLGESDIMTDPSRAVNSFARPNWERLQALRKKYDPEGVFHPFEGV
jgi:FAD/FMN-containing dehydrogenase